ncbi:Neugrin-domain-containing protein [Dissophora ornata]|nr:Required for respiratory growth protein 9 mitochondrial [Dissophora ornata]KAI8605815.1 Neugrin-domain-containing protein [Dissophora ornata]
MDKKRFLLRGMQAAIPSRWNLQRSFGRQGSGTSLSYWTKPSHNNDADTSDPMAERSIGDLKTEADNLSNSISDGFNTNTMQEARERWGLGAIHVAAIVFPHGRPEIMNHTRMITESRIWGGQVYQAPQDMCNGPDQRPKSAMDMRTRNRSSSTTPSPILKLQWPNKGESSESVPQWLKHKLAIKEKLLGKAWNPQRKLSRQAMEEVRYLRKQFPDQWTTSKLAEHFNVASEAIVRILKTDFRLSPERLAEQDTVKEHHRKSNISADVEKIKAERHASWLELRANRERNRRKAGATTSRIKLGAPKRSIVSE